MIQMGELGTIDQEPLYQCVSCGMEFPLSDRLQTDGSHVWCNLCAEENDLTELQPFFPAYQKVIDSLSNELEKLKQEKEFLEKLNGEYVKSLQKLSEGKRSL